MRHHHRRTSNQGRAMSNNNVSTSTSKLYSGQVSKLPKGRLYAHNHLPKKIGPVPRLWVVFFSKLGTITGRGGIRACVQEVLAGHSVDGGGLWLITYVTLARIHTCFTYVLDACMCHLLDRYAHITRTWHDADILTDTILQGHTDIRYHDIQTYAIAAYPVTTFTSSMCSYPDKVRMVTSNSGDLKYLRDSNSNSFNCDTIYVETAYIVRKAGLLSFNLNAWSNPR